MENQIWTSESDLNFEDEKYASPKFDELSNVDSEQSESYSHNLTEEEIMAYNITTTIINQGSLYRL